jgi:HEAT repeat protein
MGTKGSKESLADQMLALNEILLHERIRGLQDPNPSVRRKAVRGLSGLGMLAERARPLLEALLNDPVPRVREAAAETLKGIHSDT